MTIGVAFAALCGAALATRLNNTRASSPIPASNASRSDGSGLTLAAPDRTADPGDVEVRYLGAGGVSLQRGDDHILTAPFFSNPSLGKVVFGRIHADPRRFPPQLEVWTRDVQAILIGHAHYDHLMDLPQLAPYLPPDVVLYGNDTAAHILAAVPALAGRVEALNARAGTAARAGDWIPIAGGRMRLMALRSGHAPHFAGMLFYSGSYDTDLDRLPSRASGWKMGQPLSFIIDVLDSGATIPLYRIFYQDAASAPPAGIPPPMADGKRFDLAILCVAGFSKVHHYPEAVVKALRPAAVMLIHWEDFFAPPGPPWHPVTGTNPAMFIERLKQVLPPSSRFWMPSPGERRSYPVSPGAGDTDPDNTAGTPEPPPAPHSPTGGVRR
ncbi:MAG: MBL fold metallo-hydrolase [Acidobacteriota bacterium]